MSLRHAFLDILRRAKDSLFYVTRGESRDTDDARAKANTLSEKLSEAFWMKVRKTDSCWLWQGPANKGIPLLRISIGNAEYRISARRVSWEIKHGPLDRSLVLIPKGCTNDACVNPGHLKACTKAERSKYAVSLRKRTAKGQAHGMAKLSRAIVSEIRTRYAAGGISQIRLAKEFGVTENTIRRVIHNKLWKEE